MEDRQNSLWNEGGDREREPAPDIELSRCFYCGRTLEEVRAAEAPAHRTFCSQRGWYESHVFRLPNPARCRAVESGGVRCELRRHHQGDCDASEACAAFLARRAS